MVLMIFVQTASSFLVNCFRTLLELLFFIAFGLPQNWYASFPESLVLLLLFWCFFPLLYGQDLPHPDSLLLITIKRFIQLRNLGIDIYLFLIKVCQRNVIMALSSNYTETCGKTQLESNQNNFFLRIKTFDYQYVNDVHVCGKKWST